MTEPTWTPWLENPGTGKNPVPDFAEDCWIRFPNGDEICPDQGNAWYLRVCVNGEAITDYCYAVPDDLAWLAENVSEWKGRTDGYVVLDKQTHQVYFDCGTKYGNSYDRPQWLRARQDLGYESGEKVGAKNDNPLTPSKYHRQIKGVYVDVYDILHAFGITNPGDQHAIKKMLQPGKRGYKDARQDREEAIMSLERANELEDGE